MLTFGVIYKSCIKAMHKQKLLILFFDVGQCVG